MLIRKKASLKKKKSFLNSYKRRHGIASLTE